MIPIPTLGVGVIYSPGLEGLFEAGRDVIDVVEVEPETLWLESRLNHPSYRFDTYALDLLLQYPQRKLVHGVGFPVGGTLPPEESHLEPFTSAIAALDSPWASEHLSFNQVNGPSGSSSTGFLLPPLQTPELVTIVAGNIANLRDSLPVPFAFETGANYLQPQPGELTDGEFFAAVADSANCGILLDLHNVWTNQENGRQSVLDLVDELALERVWEIHLGGGEALDGYRLDAHSDLVPPQVMELAQDVVVRLPNLKALVFEITPEYVMAKGLSIDSLLEQIHQMRNIWEARGRDTRIPQLAPRIDLSEAPTRMPSPDKWEWALTEAIRGKDTADSGELTAHLAGDPGVAIYRKLISSVRAGMAVTNLKLTSRLLRLSLGELAFEHLLHDFWRAYPPALFSSAEASNFGSYLRTKNLSIPHLYEVLTFELALQKVLVSGTREIVRFSCDPGTVLGPLQEGRLPDHVGGDEDETPFELELRGDTGGRRGLDVSIS